MLKKPGATYDPPEAVKSEIAEAKSMTEEQKQELLKMMEEWASDESGYDEEIWPKLKEALEADRSSSRKLFADE